MPTYQYEALDQTGKPQKGALDAQSSDEAIARIKQQGFFPTSIREKKVKAKPVVKGEKKKKEKTLRVGGRVKTKILVQFTRQLSTLQDAGLPILRSLQILIDQQRPGNLKGILTDVANEVEGGMALSEAMAKHPKCFDRLYYKMIAAGEVGGVLDIILQRLADFMEKAQKLKAKIKGAMIYPIAVISVAVLILTGIMIFVVPKFQEIFADFDTDLPAPTLLLMGTANWMVGSEDQLVPGWIIVLGSPFFFMFMTKTLKRSRGGKNLVDKFYMTLPVVGKLIQLNAIAKFTRTLGTLIGAGVPILEAIIITRDTVGNYMYENALQKVHDAIREGESFAGPLREAKVCDALVVNMIDVGEETGDLDKMLMKIADNYDEEVDNAVQALVSMLEPAMVVFLGGMVGFIVVSLFLPLVKLIQSVSG
jgi:type IV pilus assembly protein PilC